MSDLTNSTTRKPPKSWRTCPACYSRATKIFHLNSGKLLCQICDHEYDPPNGMSAPDTTDA